MPIPRTCHGWLTHSLTFYRIRIRCRSQQYTAEGLNKLADSEHGAGSVGEYRQMNLMMNIWRNFVSELLAEPCFLCTLSFVCIQWTHVSVSCCAKWSESWLGCHYPLIQLGGIFFKWLTSPSISGNCVMPQGILDHPCCWFCCCCCCGYRFSLFFRGHRVIWQPDVYSPTELQSCRGEREWKQKNTE